MMTDVKKPRMAKKEQQTGKEEGRAAKSLKAVKREDRAHDDRSYWPLLRPPVA